MKKIILIILIGIMMIGLVSALDKQFDSPTKVNLKENGNTKATFEVIENTNNCGGENICYAIIKADVKSLKKGVFDSVRFEDIKDKKNIKSKSLIHNIYVLKSGNYVKYDSNENFNGVYYFKITGIKGENEIIDWIPTLYGTEIKEWLVWGANNWYDTIGNSSLWNNETGTGGSNLNLQLGGYSANVSCSKAGSGGGTQQLTTTNLPSVGAISEITIKAEMLTYKSSGGSVATSEAFLGAFGGTVKSITCGGTGDCSDSDTSTWRLVRNITNFVVYNDGVYSSTITPTNNNISFYGSCDLTSATIASYVNTSFLNYTIYNGSLNITYNTPSSGKLFRIGENVTFNITTNAYANTLQNLTLYINNTEKNFTTITGINNQTTFSWNSTDLTNGIYYWTTKLCDNENNCLYGENRQININKAQYSFTGGITPSCSVTYGSISDSYVYTGGNSSTETITCTLEGYNDYTETYDIHDGDKTFTMTSKSLSLWFRLYNGTLQSTSGYWTDGNITQNFTSNNLTISLTDMQKGTTRVYFGYNTSIMNFTQFYDFENDWIVDTNENLTLLTTTTNEVYLKVRDISGDPINDALVRISISNPSYGGEYKVIGQRFTGDDGISGIVKFNIPSDSDIAVRVTKDGYTYKRILRNINSAEYTASNPINIDLSRTDSGVYRGVYITTYEKYNNNTSTIPIYTYAPSRDTVTFYTNYDTSNNYTISLDEYKQGSYTLTRGVQYCSSCTTDLNVTFYVDGVLYNTYTIKYQAIDESKFTTPTGINHDFEMKMIWIALIIIVGISGLLFKSGEESIGSGKMGKSIFMIGSLVIPLLFLGEYVFLLIVTVIYGVGLILRRFISE